MRLVVAIMQEEVKKILFENPEGTIVYRVEDCKYYIRNGIEIQCIGRGTGNQEKVNWLSW